MALNLGFYDPPKSGRGRVPAYFFRDPDGQIPETATLYHEVSHQLLFETAGPNAYTKNAGNYWVFEGLGTYFETVTPQPDGSLEVGGLVGPRIDEAFRSLVVQRRMIPMAEFVAFDEATFRDKVQIYRQLPAGDGHDRVFHAMERRSLSRRVSRLRARRVPRADQTRHRAETARSPTPAVRKPSTSNSSPS